MPRVAKSRLLPRRDARPNVPLAPVDLAGLHAAACHELASPRWRSSLTRRLLHWYSKSARDLPWRRSRDPYSVWVSEIMLQQTVVAAVIPYFERFKKRFPTVGDLARADEQEVLRYWEGLGYYRRARQMHRAAQVILAEHQGQFPADAAAVRALPGVGRYTAGAVLSIAFDQRHPILEANSIRLLARLLAFGGATHSTAAQKLLWSAAEQLLPTRDVGRFNQALMELGSQVCTPRNPRCEKCPLATLCPTHRQGLTEQIPAARARPQIEEVREAAVVVRRGAKVLLVRRGPDERWAGMWDFPRFPLLAEDQTELARQLAEGVARRASIKIEPGRRLTIIHHSVTRFRIALACYEAQYVAQCGRTKKDAASAQQPQETCWVVPAELGEFPLSTSARKLARLVAGQK